MTTNR